jgi:hypothetical protein
MCPSLWATTRVSVVAATGRECLSSAHGDMGPPPGRLKRMKVWKTSRSRWKVRRVSRVFVGCGRLPSSASAPSGVRRS